MKHEQPSEIDYLNQEEITNETASTEHQVDNQVNDESEKLVEADRVRREMLEEQRKHLKFKR